MTATRQWLVGISAAMALTTVISGCAGDTTRSPAGQGRSAPEEKPEQQARVIGDGSTSITGRQPNQPVPRKLRTGKKPPQFVVFSWDGAGEDDKKLFSRFRKAGKRYGASQSYFLSGIYALPEAQSRHYSPPGHATGASDIGYLKDKNIRATLREVRKAWLEGNEIGTHFNGHFCGPNGVGSWSSDQWKSEIRQAKWFVKNWKTTTGFKREQPLPFDYDQELIGGRAPCLQGQENLLRAARQMGFRYDSSGNGTQVWPGKKSGLWDVPLQEVPMPGRKFETLSMDYNFLANQSGTATGPSTKHVSYGQQMREGLMKGFERAYKGNRAPLVIGNHFEKWNGGVYMDAVEHVMKSVCKKREVRCVSFKQLVDWLDEQDPKVLAKLRTLGIGERPKEGWGSFLKNARTKKLLSR
ncbi:polysaccharide deacetylase family protein [Streptomyces winkii]|uniref:hypothetical protein n=1 Tax=Streptomyces winkii TaxID=3051178 RepID=UPI0028D3B419|nr:hypothetical protein [Streptomyces sp. DSM 40971]